MYYAGKMLPRMWNQAHHTKKSTMMAGIRMVISPPPIVEPFAFFCGTCGKEVSSRWHGGQIYTVAANAGRLARSSTSARVHGGGVAKDAVASGQKRR